MNIKKNVCLSAVIFQFVFLFGLIGCIEKTEEPDVTEEAEKAKKQILDLINNEEESIIWKIEAAILKNKNGSFDISDNSNTIDDEFVFTKNPIAPNGRVAENNFMEWRIGDGINIDAVSIQDAIQDYLLPNEEYLFSIEQTENKFHIELGEGDMRLEIFNDNKLKGQIFFKDQNAELEVVLKRQDIKEAKSKIAFLEFEPFTTINLSLVTGHAPDLTKSASNNSIYFSGREDSNSARPQRVIKIDIQNKALKEVIELGHQDFVTKTSVVIQDRLYIFGGQVVWIYNLDLNLQQDRVSHGDTYTRFGMSSVKDDFFIYAVTDLNVGQEASPDIFKFNLATLKKEKFFTAPEMKTNTRGAINFDYLYIFGGSSTWIGGEYDGFLRRINLKTKEFSKNPLPFGIERTFSSRRNHEIFYMGLTENNEKNHQLVIFDTNSETYNVVDTNLKILEPALRSQVAGLTILDNYLYILFGAETPGVEKKDWTIYRTLLP
jgi:hypothetical protein